MVIRGLAMGYFPCMRIKLERTGDSLVAEWYDSILDKWVEKKFERGRVDDALAWLKKEFISEIFSFRLFISLSL